MHKSLPEQYLSPAGRSDMDILEALAERRAWELSRPQPVPLMSYPAAPDRAPGQAAAAAGAPRRADPAVPYT